MNMYFDRVLTERFGVSYMAIPKPARCHTRIKYSCSAGHALNPLRHIVFPSLAV